MTTTKMTTEQTIRLIQAGPAMLAFVRASECRCWETDKYDIGPCARCALLAQIEGKEA